LFELGDGDDTVTVSGEIGGNARFDLGSGSDTFTLTGQALIGENLMINGGNENDNLQLMPGSVVLGDAIRLGRGTGSDTVTFSASASQAQLLASLGKIHVDRGTGNDTVTFSVYAPQAQLIASLGNGSDTFTFGGSAVLESQYIDGGNGIDVYQQAPRESEWPSFNQGFEQFPSGPPGGVG
jgi:hypothetical protein